MFNAHQGTSVPFVGEEELEELEVPNEPMEESNPSLVSVHEEDLLAMGELLTGKTAGI